MTFSTIHKLAGGMMLLAVAACAIAGPTKHHARHSKHGGRSLPSAQEARVASFHKAQLRNRLRGLSGHIHQVRTKIHEAKVQENRITENIETVEARIERTRHSLARVNARLHTLDAQHDEAVANLDATQQRLAQRRTLLSQRLRDNYQRGRTTYVQVLMQSRSVHDLISRGYYVRRIVQSDTELIQGVKSDITQIEADKRKLEAQAREQKDLAAEYEAQKAQYAADVARKQELLHGVQAKRAEAQEELDDLEDEANAMTERIRTLSAMLKRRQEAQRAEALARRRAAMRHRRQDTPNDDNEDNGDESPAPVWHGGFLRPTDGPITSGFGYRYHPILHRRKLHTGMDFGAPYGASIRAAGAGTVILAQYNHGYGNCVIIDHGNGVATLYGHASALLVSEGETVHAGQVIARVGATGLATGPHLHFEVRRNGVPVQPPF